MGKWDRGGYNVLNVNNLTRTSSPTLPHPLPLKTHSPTQEILGCLSFPVIIMILLTVQNFPPKILAGRQSYPS